MSEIDALRELIEKEKERGCTLDKQISAERKLYEEAEERKKKLMIALLKEELEDLQRKNVEKQKELEEIEKCKLLTLQEVADLESRLAVSVSLSFLYDIFFMCISIFYDTYVNNILFFIMTEKDQDYR